MPDLMAAIDSLQKEIGRGMKTIPCELNSQYRMIYDEPHGEKRFTYAKIIGGKVQALANFVLAEPIDGIPCFNVGYAVDPKHRGRGLGLEAASTGIAELKNGFGRTLKGKDMYLEAVVEKTNTHSVKVAQQLFSATGDSITDAPTGKPALYFKMLVKL
jgi:hypothetical protein